MTIAARINQFESELRAEMATQMQQLESELRAEVATQMQQLESELRAQLQQLINAGPRRLDATTGLSSAVPTRVLHVPREHSTVQAAVDAAQPGERVLLAAGVYNESVKIRQKHVDIVGAGTAGSVVLRYSGDANVVSVRGVANVSLSNLTIRHRGGARAHTVRGAILARGGSTVQVEGCDLCSQAGCGVYASQEGTYLRLEGCTIHDCKESGIVISDRATATVQCCTSNDNIVSGIQLQDGSSATLRENMCFGNQYGICILELDGEDPTSAVVESNRLHVPGSCNSASNLHIDRACRDRVRQRNNTL